MAKSAGLGKGLDAFICWKCSTKRDEARRK